METIQIPEGYVIDTEKSNERQIVLMKIGDKKVRSWEEYCEKMKGKTCYYVNNFYYETKSSLFGDTPLIEEFDNEEDAVAFDAYSKLLKMRRQWLGEWKPDYKNRDEEKFTIITADDEITKKSKSYYVSSPMSFPTEKMRDEFFDTFKDLLELAKTLL